METPEGFPKGRRNSGENDINCAKENILKKRGIEKFI